MFIRFVSAEIDPRSQVTAGLFCAAAKLKRADNVADHELDALWDLSGWFDLHLESPFHHLGSASRYARGICWFKPSAHEHLARAWEMITILENNGLFIRTVKSRRAGYVLYEDEAQVLAEPFADVRLLL